jgi:hypothetical protein
MATYFHEYFRVKPESLEQYGALNISLVTDLQLFIDPFLLFNSKKREYRQLHEGIIAYLVFLRDKAARGEVPDPLLRGWYCFKEVKQTWLGFSKANNSGSGLGMDFARSLHSNLHRLFPDFGVERITKGSHLRKQAEIYKKASSAKSDIKAIIFFTLQERRRVDRILKRIGLLNHPDIILIDARGDNKPSGSKA